MVEGMLPLPRKRTAAATRLLMIVPLALAATLGGCGQTSATYSGSVLALQVSEYEITPESVHMFAGTVRIKLHNDGVLVHEVAVANADGTIAGQTGAVFPGHTGTSPSFTLAPGTYRVYDPGANYADLGAYGSLSVAPR
jgi:hypothetical protein